MRHIFVYCIAAGQVDFKSPYTAAHQPSIRECFMILTQEDLNGDLHMMEELSGPSAFNLNKYNEAIAHSDTVVVGHSVEYHHGHLRAAMIAAGIDPHDGRVKTICTMLSLTGIVPKANGRRGWPTFGEACAWAGVERASRETAEDNARALMQVFRAMEKAGVVPEPRIWKER